MLSALLVQTLSRYYDSALQDIILRYMRDAGWLSPDQIRIAFGFRPLIFLSRFGIPLLLIFYVYQFSWKDMGFCRPQMKPAFWYLTIAAVFLIPVGVAMTAWNDQYVEYYKFFYSNSNYPPADRLLRFSFFTLTTFFPWQFLHRSFLLFGVFTLLTKKWRLSEEQAGVIAIVIVACFEVLYHFLKPDVETWALLVGSPLLSWIALRTRSLALPVLFHFLVEGSFILTMIFVSL